jgi:pimeloyl-ACP methyl ester carboxylesterase
MLELITHEPQTTPRATPLLFVHGAWHGAWCWEDYFLPYFAEHGYQATALSLRGHGNSPGKERLRWTRARHHVADIAQVVQQFDTAPVIIAHSMGGYVMQKYLEKYSAPAAVLLASVPSYGVRWVTLRTVRHHPWQFLKVNLQLRLYPLMETAELAQSQLFSADMPAEQVQRHWQRLQDESYSTFLDMLLLDIPKPHRVKTPLLIIGGQNDRIILPYEVEATARAYQTEAVMLPDLAHDIMLEDNWQTAADTILAWLQAREL